MAGNNFLSGLSEKIREQQWFLQLKAKWEELDEQSRLYLRIAGIVVVVGGVSVIALKAVWGVYALKSRLAERTELLEYVDNGNRTMRELRGGVAPRPAAAEPAQKPDWKQYVSAAAGRSGIDEKALEMSQERRGTPTESSEEALFDVTIRGVSIRQLVRLAHNLENGEHPAKLRMVDIDTKDDKGYLDAVLSVSGFTLVPEGTK